MKYLFAFALVFASINASASQESGQVTPEDVLSAVRQEPAGVAALNEGTKPGCQIQVTELPQKPFGDFKVRVSCEDPGDEYQGGGVYLVIEIDGIYFDKGSGEILVMRFMRAG